MAAYYNENDPFAAAWLRNLIAAGHLPSGDVDDRSIKDVRPDDLRGYSACHFFAGIGGWPLAGRLAGLPDDFAWWTGSCPCQPFSVAGKGKGTQDERHLWPEFARLIRERRPPVVLGEQVAGKAGLGWLDGVCADLEGCDYACGAAVMPACAVDAPHRRERLWWVAVADAEGERRGRRQDDEDGGRRERALADHGAGSLEHTEDRWRGGRRDMDGSQCRPGGDAAQGSERYPAIGAGDAGFWRDAIWLVGADGKARRVKPGVRLLAHGVPNRVGRLRGFGNAIVPQLAATFITAALNV